MDKTLENIQELIRERGMSEKQFLSDNGFSATAMSDWKAGRMKSYQKHIRKIADYFGVYVDFLLGREEKQSWRKERQFVLMGKGGPGVQEILKLTEEEYDAAMSVIASLRRHKGSKT